MVGEHHLPAAAPSGRAPQDGIAGICFNNNVGGLGSTKNNAERTFPTNALAHLSTHFLAIVLVIAYALEGLYTAVGRR